MKNRFSKVLCSVLAAMLILMLGMVPAAAETAQYRSTQGFLDFLDQRSISYFYEGVTDSGERVEVTYTLDNFESITIVFFFKDDCEEVSLRVWDIIKASAGKNYVLSTVNSLNADYKFVKFVFDESDSTVQAEIDMYIDGDHCDRSLYDAMYALINIIDNDKVAEKLHSLE